MNYCRQSNCRVTMKYYIDLAKQMILTKKPAIATAFLASFAWMKAFPIEEFFFTAPEFKNALLIRIASYIDRGKTRTDPPWRL